MKKLLGAASLMVILSLPSVAGTWGCYIGTITCRVVINGTVYTYTCCYWDLCSSAPLPAGGCTTVTVGCC